MPASFSLEALEIALSGSRDGFQASDFHGKCNGWANTVTIIETTKDFIFGGFTPLAWDSSGSYKLDRNEATFLFTATKTSEGRRFLLSNPALAIYCHSDYGPTFGGGHDIYVASACATNPNSYTNFGNSFTNDTGINGKEVLTGEHCFIVKEIEVFAID
jgi:hypothetical protein